MTPMIELCNMSDIYAAPNYADIVEEYARGADQALGGGGVNEPLYNTLEAEGLLMAAGAFTPELVGVIIAIRAPSTHYPDAEQWMVDSFFVRGSEQGTGLGMELLAFMENTARENGADAMLASAPPDGKLAAILERKGYHLASYAMLKGLE